MTTSQNLLKTLDGLNAAQLKRLLVDQLTKQKLGLYWENSAVERDAALNAHIVLPAWWLTRRSAQGHPPI